MTEYDKIHNDIVEILELAGYDNLAKQVHALRAIHVKATAAKKRTPAKPKTPEVFLLLEITERGKTTQLRLEEKKAEAYLKAKHKERAKVMRTYQISKGVHPPRTPNYRSLSEVSRYEEALEVYRAVVTAAGMDFNVTITRE